MRTTSVFINRLGEQGFPFAGKIKFTLMSTDPDFLPNRKPVSALFVNGKAKVQLIPNIFISKNVSTYYHYEIFAQHPVNAPTEVEFELIEEGDCIVPIKPSCLQEILIPTQQGYEPSGSNCNCEEKQVSHSFECEIEPVPQEIIIGISIFDGDGDTITPVRMVYNLTPTGSQTKSFGVRFGADGFGGSLILYPYSTVLPTTDDGEHELFMDYGLPKRVGIDGSHLIATLSNGFTVDVWTQPDPNHEGQYQYGIVYAKVYGPKAEAPRQYTLDVDGVVTPYIVNIADGTEYTQEISGSEVKIYPVPTKQTRIVYSYNSSTLPVPETLSATPYKAPRLPFSASFKDEQLTLSISENNISWWPTEIADTYLKVTTTHADGTETVEEASLNCLSQYVSTQLADLDSTVNDIQETLVEVGETANNAVQSVTGSFSCTPTPALSLTTSPAIGEDTTQDIDLSCLSSLIDNKVSNLISEITNIKQRLDNLEQPLLAELGNIWLNFSWANIGNDQEIRLNKTYNLVFNQEYTVPFGFDDEEYFRGNANFSVALETSDQFFTQNINGSSSITFDFENERIFFTGIFYAEDTEEKFGCQIKYEGWTRIQLIPNYGNGYVYGAFWPTFSQGDVVGQIKLTKV